MMHTVLEGSQLAGVPDGWGREGFPPGIMEGRGGVSSAGPRNGIKGEEGW